MKQKDAIEKIRKQGILLVFPVKNAKEPPSLWSAFYPRSEMRWEWDEDSDDRVSKLWFLMKKLSDCGDVVYSKWYQGRATFMSKPVFTALLSLRRRSSGFDELSPTARRILDTLESDSPLSTRDLKSMNDLQGRDNEGVFNRSLKELFSRFLVVGYGEVNDGAFPSLAVASTRLIYEDLWRASERLPSNEALTTIDMYMPEGTKFRDFMKRSFRS